MDNIKTYESFFSDMQDKVNDYITVNEKDNKKVNQMMIDNINQYGIELKIIENEDVPFSYDVYLIIDEFKIFMERTNYVVDIEIEEYYEKNLITGKYVIEYLKLDTKFDIIINNTLATLIRSKLKETIDI